MALMKLTTHQPATVPDRDRNSCQAWERGRGRQVESLSDASSQELEAALALRRRAERVEANAEAGEPKKARMMGLPAFVEQATRGAAALQDNTGMPRDELFDQPETCVIPQLETCVIPPWVQTMQRSMELMHRKQDEAGHQMQLFRLELQGLQKRVEILEHSGVERNVAHLASIDRIDAFAERLSWGLA